METKTALLTIALMVVVFFLCGFVLERFSSSPATLRWLGLLLVVGGSLVVQLRWAFRWGFSRRSATELAELIRRRFSGVGDRLLGAVEIVEGKVPNSELSPELCRAAVAQVGRQLEDVDFMEALDRKRVIQVNRGVMILGLVAATLVAAFPGASWNTCLRLISPSSQIAKYQFVEIMLSDEELVVPFGEPFSVEAKVGYRSFIRPSVASASLRGVGDWRSGVDSGNVSWELPGLTVSTTVEVSLGDAKETVNILLEHRPFIKNAKASVKLPAYLEEVGVETIDLKGSGLQVLEGSIVQIHGSPSRQLASVRTLSGPQEARLLDEGRSLAIEGIRFDESNRWKINFTDVLGLTNRSPWSLSVRTRRDAAPRIELKDMPLESAILETDVISFSTQVRDDYAVKGVGIDWVLIGSTNQSANTPKPEFYFEPGTKEKDLRESFLFSPMVQQIPTDSTIEVVGYATDYLPGRQRSESVVHRIYVIDLVQHAEWVRANMESLFQELEEVTRGQESVATEADRLAALSEEAMEEEATATDASEAAELQEKTARQLQQMIREGAQNLKEALKNPTFTEESLGKWAEVLKQMKETSEQSMSESAQSLDSASEASDQRAGELAEAQDAARQALEELSELQGKVNEGLDNMEALTLAQRLMKLSEAEAALKDRLVQVASEVVGLESPDLTEPQKKFETRIAESQKEETIKAQEVRVEISRFFERTQKPLYGDVSRAMDESRVEESLAALSEKVTGNLVMQSVGELHQWSERFEEWSKMLKPEESSGGGEGQGEGEGASREDLMKMMLAFMRLRSSQMGVMQSTDLLAKEGKDAENLTLRSVKLVEEQARVTDRLDSIRSANPVEVLDPVIVETGGTMRQAERELADQHLDHAANGPMQQSVQLLTDIINLINEQAQQSQQQQSSSQSEAMEMLLQMVEQEGGKPSTPMPGGAKPGMTATPGSGSGSPTGRGNGGNAFGADGTRRSAKRGTGSSQSVPVEFRGMLEGYFKALESLPESNGGNE